MVLHSLWLRFPTSHMGCVNQWGPIVHNVLGSLKNIPKGRLTQQEKTPNWNDLIKKAKFDIMKNPTLIEETE